MPFTTALSGLSAASNNLAVTGNNIANANTTGFKRSRSEFADVYATNIGGVSNIQPGAGVKVANVAQQFNQGSLNFTENNLDLAISGEGFFTLANSPTELNDVSYTRAGEFKLDKEGFMVNNQGRALLVYKPNGPEVADGFSIGVTQPVQINTLTGLPRATDEVKLVVNADANADPHVAPTPAQLTAATDAVNTATADVASSTAAVDAASDAYGVALAATISPTYPSGNTADPTVVAAQADLSAANTVLATDQAKLANAQQALSKLTSFEPFDPTNPESYNTQTAVTVYDSLGASHILTTYFVKGASTPATTDWSVYHYISEPATPSAITPLNAGTYGGAVPSPATPDTIPTAAVMTFDSTGKLVSPASGRFALSDYVMVPSTGAAPLSISSMDFSGSTQVQQKFSVNEMTQNGLPAGRLTGLDIDDEGVIFARFSNGGSQTVGKVALTRFANAHGLAKLGDTTWGQSSASGEPIRGEAGSNNFGGIQSGALESSNVDLAAQLVNLIVTQQHYQANAQTITTENQIMQAILNI